jgi:hypothetical protein
VIKVLSQLESNWTESKSDTANRPSLPLWNNFNFGDLVVLTDDKGFFASIIFVVILSYQYDLAVWLVEIHLFYNVHIFMKHSFNLDCFALQFLFLLARKNASF